MSLRLEAAVKVRWNDKLCSWNSMAGYRAQSTRLQEGCRSLCPSPSTAVASEVTQQTSVTDNSKPGARSRCVQVLPLKVLALELLCEKPWDRSPALLLPHPCLLVLTSIGCFELAAHA